MREKHLCLLILLFHLITINGFETLPGIDVLTSGFDAASWSSKARIFDFKDKSQTVEVVSINKTYSAPDYLSVVTHGAHSKRVEESCVGVYTHFSEYVHTYQSSVGFDIGIHTGTFSLGIQYHKDVQKIYEAITNKGQAIGISESWWGIYETTVPPAFLMTDKFSSEFTQTVAYLKQIGTPKSELGQGIYNQVVKSFGTHYVVSIIAGGRAKMTNFVNSSYHSEHSQSTVSTQVSIGFEWKKFALSLSNKAKEFENKLTKDFRNNSNLVCTYQPDEKDIYQSKAPWLKWEQRVAEEPTVVNTSVSSLANLFFDSEEVMTHLQKTIDFYLEHHKTPTLKELNKQSNKQSLFSAEPPSEVTKTVPGLNIVGCGFDATTLSSKQCLFEPASSKLPHTTWVNPYYSDIAYTVPYGFYATNTPESLLVNSTVVMSTINDYVEKSIYYESHHHHGFLGFGSKTETTTTKKYYELFYAHNYKLALSLHQIAWFTLDLSEFPLPKFSRTFENALNFLPSVYNGSDSKTVALYGMFFNSFGTDVVTSADMGGLVWAENWFESCLTKLYSDECITHEVTRGWWFVHKHKTTKTCDKRIVSDFKKYSEAHYEMLGGTSGEVKQKDWNKWVLSVKYDPRPVKYVLKPIYYLLSDAHPKKQAFIQATNAFLQKSQDERQEIIDSLEAVRPPPLSICKRIEPKTFEKIHFHNELALDDILEKTNPADVLCPFVGYHGAFCPSKYEQTTSNVINSILSLDEDEVGVINSLPKGVGLTLDVTTGDLKLPALNYIDSPNTWTDPLTGIVYQIPTGVSLSLTNVTAENVPIVRVFKTEEDLTAVWEKGYKEGSWLGGEFGKSKGILDLYNKFFSKQQATSINQHPHGLYKLSVTGEWENNLNMFVKIALQALPAQYDANVYSRFMDTWGTHVATDTLVGGMLEQQVVMKDCVWQSPYLTGGLADAQLRDYLKMELGKTTPPDGFYQSRRQMHLDHRIGGNPELTDDKLWARSLSKNPALIKIYSQVDWGTVAAKAGIVSDTIVSNIQRAIKERMTLRENLRVQEKEETAKKRVEYLQGPRSVVAMVAHGRRGTIAPQAETGKYLTLKGFASCPPGLSITQSKQTCNTGLYIKSWNHFVLTEPLRYERNAKGEMRSVRCFDLDANRRCITHYGSWVRNGCSLQPYATGKERPFHTPVPGRTVVAMVCADCQLITAHYPQDSTLKCVCPGY